MSSPAGASPRARAAPSERRFPDGAHYRIEIPSVEGPAVLRAVVAQAAAEGITVNRVSQGSGAMLLSEAELAEMARIGADAGIEVSLFIGPAGGVGHRRAGPVRRRPGPGRADPRDAAAPVRGRRRAARGASAGSGASWSPTRACCELLAEMQADGQIPASVVWKVSAMLAPSNPVDRATAGAAGRLDHQRAADLTLGQLAEMRSVGQLPARPVRRGAQTRWAGWSAGSEAADLVAVAAPMYVKFGLRNSRPLYPSGLHLADEAAAIAREKVHRAQVALEWMARSGLGLEQSQPGARLGVPGLGETGRAVPSAARTPQRGSRLRSDAWFAGDDEVAIAAPGRAAPRPAWR